jgi:hypothetical protein
LLSCPSDNNKNNDDDDDEEELPVLDQRLVGGKWHQIDPDDSILPLKADNYYLEFTEESGTLYLKAENIIPWDSSFDQQVYTKGGTVYQKSNDLELFTYEFQKDLSFIDNNIVLTEVSFMKKLAADGDLITFRLTGYDPDKVIDEYRWQDSRYQLDNFNFWQWVLIRYPNNWITWWNDD